MKKCAVILLVILVSCSKNGTSVVSYEMAMKKFKKSNYTLAAEDFEKLDDAFPFTKDASNGLIMSAYSYYKAKKYDESIRVINYFINSNPISEYLPYLYYLKGLNYQARITLIQRARDVTETTYSAFSGLISAYPNTAYAEDAKSRIKIIRNMLSANDLFVANYYFSNRNYIGAMNHYKNIVENFKDSDYVAEALYRLVEINDIFSLKLDALQYYTILNSNYKGDKWEKYAFNIIKNYDEK
ncbi:MAG: outer membrane protein assembly factor BamD [Rickettsiales bacterium]|jgi:outer membrane protein assembly factor BamD|nr:outer membrane protein assembly factor BamD [Rickettsiales bacterium]